jgi:hypothetical protein
LASEEAEAILRNLMREEVEAEALYLLKYRLRKEKREEVVTVAV